MRKVHIGRTMLVGLLVWLLTLAGTLLPTPLQRLPEPLPTLAPALAALAVALTTTFVQAAVSTEPPAPSVTHGRVGPGPEPRTGMPWLVAAGVLVLVVGLGGWAATQAARYASQFLPVPGQTGGFEDATDRLIQPRSATRGPLSVTVRAVLQGKRTVRADIVASNSGEAPLTLPLFKNCTLTAADGTTLQADPSRSLWADTVAAEPASGTIVFAGVLPNQATSATLTFAQVYGSFEVSTISVSRLRLRSN